MKAVLGNATDEQKEYAYDLFQNFVGAEGFFCSEQARRIEVKRLDFEDRPKGEPGTEKLAKLICEIKIEKDMMHAANSVHGACILWLVDVCTSVCHSAFDFKLLSLSLTTHFHGPASLGNTLRIVSETVSVGKRVIVARCEIFEVETGAIVASGSQVKMAPQKVLGHSAKAML
ncbi:hypothetical protein CPB86DRAFT_30253 [Serendipita vermifera]|nr:hypothetical protein CPB86DRAFT_30253 [Serendipita vermifera]